MGSSGRAASDLRTSTPTPSPSPPPSGHLASGAYLEAGEPVVLLGDSGTGKTHLLIGLGLAACEQGRRVRYVTTAALVNELVEAADDRALSRVVGRYGRLDLLCLDELGYVQIDPKGAELLFQIITEREERASIAIGTNLPFSKAHMFTATCARCRLKFHGFGGQLSCQAPAVYSCWAARTRRRAAHRPVSALITSFILATKRLPASLSFWSSGRSR